MGSLVVEIAVILGYAVIISLIVLVAYMTDEPEEWDETAKCVNEDDSECWPREEKQ